MGFVVFNNIHYDFISKEQVLQIPLSHLLITYYYKIKAKKPTSDDFPFYEFVRVLSSTTPLTYTPHLSRAACV